MASPLGHLKDSANELQRARRLQLIGYQTQNVASHDVDLARKQGVASDSHLERAQCLNSSVPGYQGYCPGKYAQSSFGETAGDVSSRAARLVESAKERRKEDNERTLKQLQLCKTKPSDYVVHHQAPSKSDIARIDGECKQTLLRSYSIPLVPGYAGYVVGKRCENVMGGGTSYCARTAAGMIQGRKPDSALMYADMARWRSEAKSIGDDLYQNPNFLRKPFNQISFKNDSAICAAQNTFNTKYGFKPRESFGKIPNPANF